MKKTLLLMAATATLLLGSCKKNPAEQYEGTYLLTQTGTYTIDQAVAQDDKNMGEMTITLVGEDGQVKVSGDIYNTTGTVNKDGILLLDKESHKISDPNSEHYVKDVTYTHTQCQISGNNLSWTTTLEGNFNTEFPGLGVVDSRPMTGNYSNVAIKK